MATGLLVVLVGRATKLSNIMLNKTKTYEADITFGTSTDTFDKMGKVIDKLETFELNQTQIDEGLAYLKAQKLKRNHRFIQQLKSTAKSYMNMLEKISPVRLKIKSSIS